MSSKIVVCDYDYDGEDDSQLTFKEGDRILVLEEDESGWWTGRLEKNGNEGYFPSTYVKPLDTLNEEFEDVVIEDDVVDVEDEDKVHLQVSATSPAALVPSRSASRDDKDDKIRKLGDKEYKASPRYSSSATPSIGAVAANADELKVDAKAANKTSNDKEGENATTSPEIDYNNYFPNAQKLSVAVRNPTNSVSEGPDGGGGIIGGAEMENYYAAEVLNLKFNPNAKTRFGLASHYMSMFASIGTIVLSTASFSWYNGSPFLMERGLVSSYDMCLIIGLYGFFGGIVMFLWEYVRGDIRQKRSIPLRSILYFCIGLPLFFTIPTALSGVFWLNTTILSALAFKNGETYERKKKRAYSDKKIKTPKEKILNFFSLSRIRQSCSDRLLEIRQQSQVRKYLFLIVYSLFNIIYILYWAGYYSENVAAINDAAERQTDFKDFNMDFDAETLVQLNRDNTVSSDGSTIGETRILTSWFPMAKMFGNLLDINCAFILLPVCRSFIRYLYNISTDQRATAKCCNFFLSFMPLDKALQFHKLCALLIVIGTICHTWAHFNHFAFVPATYDGVFGETVWISGSLIIICMQFIYSTSLAAVRHGKFELFWYTHHLFVLFFSTLLLHGKNSINPNFWKWFLIPGVLYIVERTLRELRARQPVGVVSVTHMNNKNARIFCLELEKTGPIRNHQEGQYVFIKSPIVSKFQWHPFTISSPPDQKTLTLHIRNMGDGSWTDRVQQFFQAIAPGKAYAELYHRDGNILTPQTKGPDGNNLICIDGPMAAPTQHLGEYSVSIIVGAGIGVTPVRSTLQSIVYYRFKRGIGQTFPDQAYCVWIVNYKQLDAYRFMCRSLKEAEDELYNMRKKNKQQMETKLLQMHIFVTSVPDNPPRINLSEFENAENDRQKDLALWGPHYDENLAQQDDAIDRETAPFDEVDIWRQLKAPTAEPTQIGDIIIHKGRPKWDQFFGPIQAAHKGHRIGVMFCGPDIIAKDLKKSCGKFTDFDSKTIFLLHKENF